MSSTTVKAGGIAGVLAAVLFTISTVLHQVAPLGLEYTKASDYVHQIVLCGAFAATVIAILGLHARQRPSPRYGGLGTAGTILAAVGYASVVVVVVITMIVGGRAFDAVRLGGALVLLVGSILLGIAVFRTRQIPWWCGALLIVAFPLGHVTNQMVTGTEGIWLALLWGSVGAALLRRPAQVREPVSRESVTAA